jgi:hypothetical protein
MIALVCLSMVSAQAPVPTAVKEETVRLEGRVVDLRGEPVPVAEVWVVTWQEPDKVLARGLGDGDGFFLLGKVPKRGAWLLCATAKGMTTGREYVSGAESSTQISLHAAGVVRGRLRDRAGKPVSGAAVRARLGYSRILHETESRATTDAEGLFVLEKVPVGLVVISAVVPGEGLARSTLHVAADAETSLSPGDERTTSLAIDVKNLPDGQSSRLVFSLLPYTAGRMSRLPPPWESPVLDKSGHCELVPAPDWDYIVRPGLEGFVFSPVEMNLKAGQGPHHLVFSAETRGASSLRCPAVLRDPQGKPVADMRLAMRQVSGGPQAEAVSAMDGTLVFDSSLASGTAAVVFSLTDGWVLDQPKVQGMIGQRDARFLAQHECQVDPTQTMELRAARACAVVGRVLLSDGRPAALTAVRLEEQRANGYPSWMPFSFTATDRDGRFRRLRLHPMNVPVCARIDGHDGAAESDTFALDQPGTTITLPDLKLSPPATVEGVVRDATGKALPGARVWLRDWDLASGHLRTGSVVEVLTDMQGRYRFVGVPPGGALLQWMLTEEHPANRLPEPFEVKPGETLAFDLTYPPK